LEGIAHVKLAADRRNAEWSVTRRKIRVGKRAGGLRHERENLVQNVNLVVVEISGIEKVCAPLLANAMPL
jgi:hypothetical protein